MRKEVQICMLDARSHICLNDLEKSIFEVLTKRIPYKLRSKFYDANSVSDTVSDDIEGELERVFYHRLQPYA